MKTIYFMIITITLLLFILGNGYFSHIYETIGASEQETFVEGVDDTTTRTPSEKEIEEKKKIDDKNRKIISSINGYNTQFHDSIEDIIAQRGGVPNENIETTKILDNKGNPVTVKYSKTLGNPTYNIPGKYVYGSQSWVPNYDDSIYLSNAYQPRHYATTPTHYATTISKHDNDNLTKNKKMSDKDIASITHAHHTNDNDNLTKQKKNVR